MRLIWLLVLPHHGKFYTQGQLHTTDGRAQRPVDIARASGFKEIIDILEPPEDKIPQISDETLKKIQEHLNKLVIETAQGLFEPETIRFPDLAILREIDKIWMPIPGMYGVSRWFMTQSLWEALRLQWLNVTYTYHITAPQGFHIWFEGHKLVTESFCRIMGGSGRTHNINADGVTMVAEGWG